MKEADVYLGDIIFADLDFDVFDRQLAKAKSPVLLRVKDYPSAILGASLPQSNIANRLAGRLMKGVGDSELDIDSQFKKAAGILDGSNEQVQTAHIFLPYAQEYWLFQTRFSRPARVVEYSLWQCLIDGKINTILEFP